MAVQNVVSVSMTVDLESALKDLAKKEGVTFSKYVRDVLKRHVDKKR